MIYLNENDIKKAGVDWSETINVIEDAVICLKDGDYSQPIKPYLRYRDLRNRIIAMPAYVGDAFNVAGIKWIASFPDNIYKNIPRAHSIVILNNAETGEPVSIINASLLSIIRTASVSGLFLKHYDKARRLKGFNLGIIGWGPIGQYHFKMCTSLFPDDISRIFLFDIRPVIKNDNLLSGYEDRIVIADSWEDVYKNSDVFITCTVASEAYIDKKPKDGSLLLNISLRDFKPDIYEYVSKSIIVDDWDEVCRENTDIEKMHMERNLGKSDTKSIVDVVCGQCLKNFGREEVIMFNPMGMAVFDISMGMYYMKKSHSCNIGMRLE